MSIEYFMLLYWQLSDEEESENYQPETAIINILQDIMEIITQDVMVNGNE